MKMIPMLIALIIITVVLTVLGLSLFGVLELPGMSNSQGGRQNSGRQEVPAGMELAPLSIVPISAFSRVSRDHIIDPSIMAPRLVPVKINGSANPPLTDLNKIIGRVLGREKAAGYVFTEADFLPEGTNPGIGAAVPPGFRAVVLPAGRLNGAFSLSAGDRIDIVATSRVGLAALTKNRIDDFAHLGLLNSLPGGVSRVVAKNAIILRPMTIRREQVEVQSGLVGTNKKFSTKENYEITIGVDPADATLLNEAFAGNDMLTAFARSTRPGSIDNDIPEPRYEAPVTFNDRGEPVAEPVATAGTSPSPEATPAAAVEAPSTVIETVIGSNRRRVVFQQQPAGGGI